MSEVYPAIKRALALVVAVVATVAISQAAVKPAHAHNVAGWGWCTQQHVVCVSVDANGYGSHAVLGPGQGFCLNLPWNDRLTGIDSHTAVNFYVWNDAGCNGTLKSYGAFVTTNVAWPNNDKGTSYCIGVNTQSSCGAFF